MNRLFVLFIFLSCLAVILGSLLGTNIVAGVVFAGSTKLFSLWTSTKCRSDLVVRDRGLSRVNGELRL
mgnify:CR=1 FL=1